MDWITWVIVIAVIIGFVAFKRIGLIGAQAARDRLREGARIIDVRTESEFAAGHLPQAINIPLDRLAGEISRVAPDIDQPLLLHCLSGTRSGLGKSALKRMGYRKVYNLGSFGRAGRITRGVAS